MTRLVLINALAHTSAAKQGVPIKQQGLQTKRFPHPGINTLKLWDLATGEEVATLTGHSDSVNAVAITPDGKQAVSASGDNTLKLWDLATGEELATLTGHSSSVKAVAITPDGKQAVSASEDKTLKLWNLATGDD